MKWLTEDLVLNLHSRVAAQFISSCLHAFKQIEVETLCLVRDT